MVQPANAPARESVRILARITAGPLEGLPDLEALASDADGAVLTFVGRVREQADGKRVTGLAYEAYEEMAEDELERICREASERFDVGAVVAVHRTGALEIGEASVAIGVAAPHRGPCYEASRYVIEQLKLRLPVWKHESYADGTSVWVGAPEGPAR